MRQRKQNSPSMQAGGLNEFARRKLGALIPLLGSDVDGEVLATVAAIRRTLQAAALDLHGLAAILTASEPERPAEAPPKPPERPWSATAVGILKTHGNCRYCLNQVEKDFLAGLVGRIEVSDKQLAWIARIEGKVTELHDAA